MSFIYENPWLIEKLLQAASESEKKLSKEGQATPPPKEDPVPSALRAMLNNLRDQITPLKEGPNQIGHASGGTELVSRHMDSMGDLVQWMSKNGTRIGNAVIVQPGNVERPSEDYGYFKIEPGTEIIVPLAKPDRSVVAYWINPEALKQYLVSLQSDQKLKNNVIFQVQLLKLIQDANRQLDVEISEKYEAPEKPDNYPLDQTPKILMSNDSKQGTELLTYGDLKSPENFNGWLISHKIGVMNDKNTLADNQDQFMKNGSHCVALNILYYRASTHLRASVRAEDSERFKIAMSQLQKLAPLYQCTLSGTAQPGQQPGQGQQGSGSQITPRALVGLAALRPFNTQRIDFQEIETFLDKYVQIKPSVAPLVGQVKNAMQLANGILKSPGAPLQVGNMNTQEVKLWTNQPLQLLNYLYTIISVAGRVYTDFFNECQNVFRDMRGGDSILQSVEEQITNGGPQQVNLWAITRVMPTFQQQE